LTLLATGIVPASGSRESNIVKSGTAAERGPLWGSRPGCHSGTSAARGSFPHHLPIQSSNVPSR